MGDLVFGLLELGFKLLSWALTVFLVLAVFYAGVYIVLWGVIWRFFFC